MAPIVPITVRLSSTANRMVFTAMSKPIRMPANTVRLKLCVAFSKTAGRWGRGGPAVATPAITRSTSVAMSAPVLGSTKAAVAYPGAPSRLAAMSAEGANRTLPSLMRLTRSNS